MADLKLLVLPPGRVQRPAGPLQHRHHRLGRLRYRLQDVEWRERTVHDHVTDNRHSPIPEHNPFCPHLRAPDLRKDLALQARLLGND